MRQRFQQLLFIAVICSVGMQYASAQPPAPGTETANSIWNHPQTASESITNSLDVENVPATPLENLQSSETPSARESLPLKKPTGRFADAFNSDDAAEDRQRATGSITTMILSLLFVLALIALIATLVKKKNPFTNLGTSSDLIEVLSRRMIDQRNGIVLIRVGQRVLIVGSSLDGLSILSEVSDPVERDQLIGQAKAPIQGNDFASSFRMFLSSGRESKEHVNLDEQHRDRARQRRDSHTRSSPMSRENTSITTEDIAELERTLTAAREGRL